MNMRGDPSDAEVTRESPSGSPAGFFVVFLLWLGMAASAVLMGWVTLMCIRMVRVLFNV
jgi:hypothetical protein